MRARSTPPAIRRRRAVALVAVAAAGAGTALALAAAGGRSSPARHGTAPARDGAVVLRAQGRELVRLRLADFRRGSRLDRTRLERRVLAALPAGASVRRGRARIAIRYSPAATARRVLAVAGSGGGTVDAAPVAVSASVDVPILRQAQRNTCESAALSILLAGLGRRVDQRRLQAELPRSGPLDPQGDGPERIWGDPDEGFVGRADGGGVAGGFGVYPPPIVRVAARNGVRLEDLSGRAPARVYARLLAGLPVMAWVGLSDGPYGEWRTPAGRTVRVNFGEHTVVLAGIDADGALRVSNPLQGTAERWTKAQFELMWQRLGRRAVAPAAV